MKRYYLVSLLLLSTYFIKPDVTGTTTSPIITADTTTFKYNETREADTLSEISEEEIYNDLLALEKKIRKSDYLYTLFKKDIDNIAALSKQEFLEQFFYGYPLNDQVIELYNSLEKKADGTKFYTLFESLLNSQVSLPTYANSQTTNAFYDTLDTFMNNEFRSIIVEALTNDFYDLLQKVVKERFLSQMDDFEFLTNREVSEAPFKTETELLETLKTLKQEIMSDNNSYEAFIEEIRTLKNTNAELIILYKNYKDLYGFDELVMNPEKAAAYYARFHNNLIRRGIISQAALLSDTKQTIFEIEKILSSIEDPETNFLGNLVSDALENNYFDRLHSVIVKHYTALTSSFKASSFFNSINNWWNKK